MKHRQSHLTTYLFGNLLILCLFLLGLWRGQPLFDTTLRLPSLLLILVVINTVLIFREGFPKTAAGARSRRLAGLGPVRQLLAGRLEPDANLLTEALEAVRDQARLQAAALFTLEEGGGFSLLTSAGSLPRQLSGLRWQVRQGDLLLRHPGGLGEETISGWESAWGLQAFHSEITRLDLFLLPLHPLGKRKALLAAAPGTMRSRALPALLETSQVLLEGLLGMHFLHTLNPEGRHLDSRTGLPRHDGFKEAFETEIERSERYKQNLTLVLLSLTPYDAFPEPLRESLTQAVVGSLRASLRRLDRMFAGKEPGQFVALLTETNIEVARLVSGRILSAFDKQLKTRERPKDPRPRLYLGTATYPNDATLGSGILEKAEEAVSAARSRDVPVIAYCALHDEAAAGGDAPESSR